MSRVRAYSRRCITLASQPLPTGLSPSAVTRSSGLRFTDWTTRRDCRPLHASRTTPRWHRRQAVPPPRFGLLPVRSPLLRESSLLLGVLRCFSSPGALQHCCWWLAVRQPGCPIRISPAHRLPAPPRSISPRGRVLLRLPPPRHPPCAHTRQSPSTAPGLISPHIRRELGQRAPVKTRIPSSHNTHDSLPHKVRRGPDSSGRSRYSRLSIYTRRNCMTKTTLLPTVRADTRAGTLVSRCSPAVKPVASRTHSSSFSRRERKNRGVSAAAVPIRDYEAHCQGTELASKACGPCGSGCSPTGGAAGIRTPDLRRARAALSRLSYGPAFSPRSPLPPTDTRPHEGGRAWTRTRDLGLIRAAL